MKHHGLLFKGEMIHALLDGRKTQTRRLRGLEEINEDANAWTITHQGIEETTGLWCVQFDRPRQSECVRAKFAVGDLLYAKENCWISKKNFGDKDLNNCADYDGDGRVVGYSASMSGESVRCAKDYGVKQSPSLLMPKWASRIWLEVTAVRCERVQDITEADALAEGITWPNRNGQPYRPPIDLSGMSKLNLAAERYSELWNTINTAPGTTWEANPWVWVYTFKRTERPQL